MCWRCGAEPGEFRGQTGKEGVARRPSQKAAESYKKVTLRMLRNTHSEEAQHLMLRKTHQCNEEGAGGDAQLGVSGSIRSLFSKVCTFLVL